MPTMTGHLRKGQNRTALTGRAARRHEARVAARAEQCPGFPVIGHRERAVTAAANAGWILVRDFLQDIGFAEWERYESATGRKIAQVYRDNHGTDPSSGGKVILRGRIWSTMRYRNVLDLIAGAHAYKRTAHLVSVPAAVEANVETATATTPTADNPQNIQPRDRVRLTISECPDEVAATVVRVYRNVIGVLVADVEIRPGDIRPQNVEFLTRTGGPVHANA
jgi:hypothetical protein